MSIIDEKILKNYPDIVSFESTEIIMNQMKKNIFKISYVNGNKSTGFFCKIPFINNEELKVLITNNHMVNLDKENEKITISMNNDSEIKEINLNNRIKYKIKNMI